MKLFGINNCDSVRKARRWLDNHQLAYRFHDVRKEGLDRGAIDAWLLQIDPHKLVNRRSTTWKNLPPHEREAIEDGDIPSLLMSHPTLLKRPLLECAAGLILGFDPEVYQNLFISRRVTDDRTA